MVGRQVNSLTHVEVQVGGREEAIVHNVNSGGI